MFGNRNKNFLPRDKKGLAFLFLGFLFLLLASFLKINQSYQKTILSFESAPEVEKIVSEEDFPRKIIIPKVGINLEVFPAQVHGDIWEISEKGTSYLIGSGVPGRPGNTIIYGHNKKYLFGPIRRLGKGVEIMVENDRKETIIYQVVETRIVSPKEVTVLEPTPDSTLTLYTCTGFMDSKRFIVVAKPK